MLDPEGFDFALDSGFWGRASAVEEVRGIYEAGLSGGDLTSAKAPEPPAEPEPVEPEVPVVPVPPVLPPVLPPIPGQPAEPTNLIVQIALGGDQVSITWESARVKLQSTSALGGAGSWTDVDGAVSPYSEAASGEVKFYRITAQ